MELQLFFFLNIFFGFLNTTEIIEINTELNDDTNKSFSFFEQVNRCIIHIVTIEAKENNKFIFRHTLVKPENLERDENVESSAELWKRVLDAPLTDTEVERYEEELGEGNVSMSYFWAKASSLESLALLQKKTKKELY